MPFLNRSVYRAWNVIIASYILPDLTTTIHLSVLKQKLILILGPLVSKNHWLHQMKNMMRGSLPEMALLILLRQLIGHLSIVQRLMRQLRHPCSWEIIMLMAWSIWKCWNGWIFDNLPPTVEGSRAFLRKELIHLLLRIKPGVSENLVSWMQSVQL
jgi:hypothetical protein